MLAGGSSTAASKTIPRRPLPAGPDHAPRASRPIPSASAHSGRPNPPNWSPSRARLAPIPLNSGWSPPPPIQPSAMLTSSLLRAM